MTTLILKILTICVPFFASFNHLLNLNAYTPYLVIWLMLKLILPCFIALSFSHAQAQSDFIVLKKRNTSLKTYFTGTYLTCILTNDEALGGYIKKIQNDSIYVKPFTLQVYADSWGLTGTDTSWMSVVRVAIKQIKAFPKLRESFAYIKDGSLIEIGAGGYMALNIINTLGKKQQLFSQQNSNRLGTAAGIFAFGLLLHYTHKDYITLGKKYHLDYIRLNSTSK